MPLLNTKRKIRSAQRLLRLPVKIELRGKVFSRAQLRCIREITKMFWREGRTSISVRICRRLRWRQPNGWLKDRACRDVLRKLDALNLIRLPKSKVQPSKNLNKPQTSIRRKILSPPQSAVTELTKPINLHLAKGNQDEELWNAIVAEHHYLGHKITVGKCLKFLVKSGDLVVGAVALSEPAWAVEARDAALTKFGISKNVVANNSRFLILPNVRVKYLASQILALLARKGASEWKKYYALDLTCLETFVDSTRFQGTSYKAANWICVGQTKGFRKSGAQHFNSQTRKYVFLYPLRPKDRAVLQANACQISPNDLVAQE